MKKNTFDPLDTNEFKSRIGESFPSVYLTIISIIQGVALGLLATNTFKYIDESYITEWPKYLPYSASSFLLIIIVSYEYTWFVGVFKWSPKIWDTIIPFVIGFSEISPMFYLTNPKIWWLLTAAFCGFGAIGFFNSLRNCNQSMFGDNINAYNRTKSTLEWDIYISLSMTLICILAGLSYSYSSSMKILYWYLYEILFLIVFFGIAIFLCWREERFMKELHSDFGLVR